MPQAPALTPFPLDLLLGRVAREWESRQRIFDLPIARFWKKADCASRVRSFPLSMSGSPYLERTRTPS